MKKLSIFTALILSMTFLKSQEVEEYTYVNFPTPNVASLVKFNEIPVSNSTGVPQISFPIYTIKKGNISLPIVLKYNSSGIRVNELASWVGLGWSLDAGGVITRTVNNKPDEGNSEAQYYKSAYFLDYGFFPPRYIESNHLFDPMGLIPWSVDESLEALDCAKGVIDTEPDRFTYNFGGQSGSFFFDEMRNSHLVADADIKIELVFEESASIAHRRIKQFILTAPNGNKYYFGGVDLSGQSTVEITNNHRPGNNISNYDIATNWYLTKIVSSDNKDIVYFEYAKENYSYWNYSGESATLIPNTGHKVGKLGYQFENFIETSLEGVRLKRIWTNGLEVIFDANSYREDIYSNTANTPVQGSKRLDKIEIVGNSMCKKFVFDYEYMISPLGSLGTLPENNDRKRLILNYFESTDCGNSTEPERYTFSYDNQLLPRRLSFSQDHWGYYNGAENSNGLTPSMWFYENGADREPRWPEMQAGILNKITYPTGGNTKFIYQNHDYFKAWNETVDEPVYTLIAGYPFMTGETTSNPYTIEITNDESLTLHLNATISQSSDVTGGEVQLWDNGQLIVGHSLTKSEGMEDYTQNINLAAGSHQLEIIVINAYSTGEITRRELQQFAENTMVGGLRISKIIQESNTGSNIETEYQYFNFNYPERSSGQLLSDPIYAKALKDNTDLETTFNCEAYSSDPNTNQLYKVASYPILPVQTIQGQNIGYPYVRVINSGNGYIDYIYNVFRDNYYLYKSRDYPSEPAPFYYDRGNLIKESYYNEQGFLLKEVNYNYETFSQVIETAIARKYVLMDIPEGCRSGGSSNTAFQLPRYIDYNLTTGYSRVAQKVTIDHLKNGDFINTVDYTYNFPKHGQVSSETSTLENGKKIRTEFIYPGDFIPNECFDRQNCINDYEMAITEARNHYYTAQSAAIEEARDECEGKSDYEDCIIEEASEIISSGSAIEDYINEKNLARASYQTCKENAGGQFDDCIQNLRNNSNGELQVLYSMIKRNITNQIVEESKWQIDISGNAKILDAKHNQYFQTVLYNPKLRKVEKLSSTNAEFEKMHLENNSLTIDDNYEIEAEISYQQEKISQVETRYGNISYLWGYNHTYPIIKVENGTYDELDGILTTGDKLSIEESTVSDQTIFNLAQKLRDALPEALITCYTYKPLVGISSITDPNGKTTYYKYDDLNRLQYIKDFEGNILQRYEYNYAD